MGAFLPGNGKRRVNSSLPLQPSPCSDFVLGCSLTWTSVTTSYSCCLFFLGRLYHHHNLDQVPNFVIEIMQLLSNGPFLFLWIILNSAVRGTLWDANQIVSRRLGIFHAPSWGSPVHWHSSRLLPIHLIHTSLSPSTHKLFCSLNKFSFPFESSEAFCLWLFTPALLVFLLHPFV